jgi:hypothetical protein
MSRVFDGRGFGGVSLGMTFEAVSELLGDPIGRPVRQWFSDGYRYGFEGFVVDFNAEGFASEILVHGSEDVFVSGIQVLGRPWQDVVDDLRNAGLEMGATTDCTVDFLGFGLYFEDDGIVMSVGIED